MLSGNQSLASPKCMMYYVVKPAVTDSGMRPLFAGTTTDVSRLVENGVASVTETEAYTGKICFGVSDDNVWDD